MRLWIVFTGEYSDRGILGVFSTKELAEECIALHNNDAYIEAVLELDEPSDIQNGYRVFIENQWEDGQERKERVWAYPLGIGELREVEAGFANFPDYYSRGIGYVGINKESFHTFVWNCTSKERAEKVAHDRLREARLKYELEHPPISAK